MKEVALSWEGKAKTVEVFYEFTEQRYDVEGEIGTL
jgi:hypothetical protein